MVQVHQLHLHFMGPSSVDRSSPHLLKLKARMSVYKSFASLFSLVMKIVSASLWIMIIKYRNLEFLNMWNRDNGARTWTEAEYAKVGDVTINQWIALTRALFFRVGRRSIEKTITSEDVLACLRWWELSLMLYEKMIEKTKHFLKLVIMMFL